MSAKLVEQLVLSLDVNVITSHDVQLLVDTIHSRVATIHQQAEVNNSLRKNIASMLSTMSTQANTILELKFTKKDMEWEITLLQEDKNNHYHPLPEELDGLQLNHQAHHQLQLGTPQSE